MNEYTAVGPATGTDWSGKPVISGARGKMISIPSDDLQIVFPAVAPGRTPLDASVRYGDGDWSCRRDRRGGDHRGSAGVYLYVTLGANAVTLDRAKNMFADRADCTSSGFMTAIAAGVRIWVPAGDTVTAAACRSGVATAATAFFLFRTRR